MATIRSRTVGAVRELISAVIWWNGSASVISVAAPRTTATLRTTRRNARSTRKALPTARPIPSSTIGPISGDTSMPPMTTAVLPSTTPRVAMPAASVN